MFNDMDKHDVLLPIVRLHLKKKKKKEKETDVSSILSAICEQVKAGVCKEGEPVWGLFPELLCWGAWLLGFPWRINAHLTVAKTILCVLFLSSLRSYLLQRAIGP